MITYRCKEGDVVDAICWRHYGRTAGVVEQVLAANPGLAERGAVLPAGTLVDLPEISASVANTISLWD